MLDTRTLYLTYAVLCLTIGGTVLLIERTSHRDRGLNFWGQSFILSGAGTILLFLRGSIPEILTIDTANALYLLAVAFIWCAVLCLFRPDSTVKLPLLMAFGCCLIFWSAHAAGADFKQRVLLMVLLPLAQLIVMLAHIRHIGRYSNPRLCRGVLLMGALLSLFLCFRIARLQVMEYENLFENNDAAWPSLLFSLLLGISGTTGYLLLTATRLYRTLLKTTRIDPLTGLLNRRSFETGAETLLVQGGGLIVFDLDHFKKINDRHGHPAGDKVLTETAARLTGCLIAGDMLARYGGEEFILLRPGAGLETMRLLADTLRQKLAETPFDLGEGGMLTVTASFGVTAGREPLASLYSAADAALYTAKQEGRNRVILAPPPPSVSSSADIPSGMAVAP